MRQLIYMLIVCLGSISLLAEANSDTTWTLEQRTPFNVKIQAVKTILYNQLTSAQKPWRVCALVPHLKDAYWIGIDSGLVSQAIRLGINLELFEAGSYYRKDQQLKQLEYCLNQPFDAILLGTVDPNLLNRYPGQINKPIIALVNRLDSPIIKTRVGVNWYQMGWVAGHFITQSVKQAPPSPPVKLALLTGPKSVGGSHWVELGIHDAIANSAIEISSIRHTDNNRDLYRDQLQKLLNDHIPDYILGSAVAIEAAIGSLQHKKLTEQVNLVSSYLSPAISRGLYRHKVAFSSDDQVVLQGRLAIDIVVKELEGANAFGDIGPQIQALEQGAVQHNVLQNSLAPADFYPIYRVMPPTSLQP
ncbi:TMAO reductase system periplasmic protein TorT [Psychromonas sp. MB-3u-54]|uniref:TMAO reductase system periplasmic protein TorT n=1 Tax=Psychromonas sp. MB-3u-54 TaxID=2058319 RepID=UPI000C338F38|nr:TMAO reductase system periplasmic protein TorT [Psychromonas sp. MB-3u-54]PKH02233.1 TMAO reductase system periplasmic protein TorT [Psychromonas sp. MB-3u-54]